MQAIKQYADVIDGAIHVKLPENFRSKRVELIILCADEINQDTEGFQQFLLQCPEMTDEEYQAIEEKRRHINSKK